ncbi:helix-turn-helix domain-containing protein [Lacicoccus alkaliphilus]|uniref:AraC-type DNA-binding protein n=1 Tax=Lacicoccus alkaliphilus DSM 16010 TaxID=1123231 RepID=A0A1M7BE47_9BACL|nr:AraC family transcriptional regulator [Salinicoccus alkaliphilus]SHL53308.1 AraC-type DNA-binding protein [Salinicoccus alkaliphilus DSM 16010]
METVNFIEKFIIYIEDHLREEIDFSEALYKLGVEPKSFITIFTSLVGMTPYEYQQKRRMTEIAYELYEGHRRLIDIAKYYGFKDADEFKHRYRESMGISPYETDKYIGTLDLLERITFEVVPVDKPEYPSRTVYVESFRIVGFTQYFSLNDYSRTNKLNMLKNLEKNGLIDELLGFNSGRIKGVILHERIVRDELELMVGVASSDASPFNETFTESGDFTIFEGTGRASMLMEDIYRYIFRRWRFKSTRELNCDFSIEVLKSPFDIDYDDSKLQVWQALE